MRMPRNLQLYDGFSTDERATFHREWLVYKRIGQVSTNHMGRGVRLTHDKLALLIYDCTSGSSVKSFKTCVEAAKLCPNDQCQPQYRDAVVHGEYLRASLVERGFYTLGLEMPFLHIFQVVWSVPNKKKFMRVGQQQKRLGPYDCMLQHFAC